jgi:hypothetical protein
VFFGIRPFVKGFFGPSAQDLPAIYKLPPPFQNEFSTGIDDFVSYEGEWELEDNDLYGGTFVKLSDRVPGETHLLQTDQKMASENYCYPALSAGTQLTFSFDWYRSTNTDARERVQQG